MFGRVTPSQKKELIAALKRKGHTVAMAGDGVNDVLALKESDCSIAMASGSDAAKNIANLVLLDSNFATMPDIVNEGRKVINNIERVATLFITKTVYAVLLAFATVILLDSSYPFTPLQMTLISFVTIGFPAFFLALEPNFAPIKEHFLINILKKSLPGGLSVIIGILAVNVLAGIFQYTPAAVSTMCMLMAVAVGMWAVSYTHLDVYKRQIMRNLPRIARAGNEFVEFAMLAFHVDYRKSLKKQVQLLSLIHI